METNLDLGQNSSDACKGNNTHFSPRVRACCGLSSTAPPLSPASQNLKPLEGATGWTFVADNIKICPARDKATSLSPLIDNCWMFWMDYSQGPPVVRQQKGPNPHLSPECPNRLCGEATLDRHVPPL